MISNIVPMIHLPPFTPIVPSHLTLAKISYDPLVAARQLLTLLADDGSADIPMPLFDPPLLEMSFHSVGSTLNVFAHAMNRITRERAKDTSK